MTRRDYTLIAAALRARFDLATADERNLIRAIANDLCPLFKSENPLFDPKRFMEAATGLTWGPV